MRSTVYVLLFNGFDGVAWFTIKGYGFACKKITKETSEKTDFWQDWEEYSS